MKTITLDEKQKSILFSSLIKELHEEKENNSETTEEDNEVQIDFSFNGNIQVEDMPFIVSCEVTKKYWSEGYDENEIGKSNVSCYFRFASLNGLVDEIQFKQIKKEFERLIEDYFKD
jgi:hypothetical protein